MQSAYGQVETPVLESFMLEHPVSRWMRTAHRRMVSVVSANGHPERRCSLADEGRGGAAVASSPRRPKVQGYDFGMQISSFEQRRKSTVRPT